VACLINYVRLARIPPQSTIFEMQIDFSLPAVQAAVISAVGVVCTLVVSLHIARRNIHKDARARARVDWMNLLRDDISRFIAQVDSLRRSEIEGKHDEIAQQRRELLRYQSRILLNLGFDGAYQPLGEKVIAVVKQVLADGLAYDPEPKIAQIVDLTQKALHREWEKASHGK
jgi:hypothetical protein